jgi:alpha-galactosidase/6-phospho-beta-glucosidase family protein
MNTVLRDPTNEAASSMRKSVAMPDDLSGKTIALLDISKERSDEFIDYLESRFTAQGMKIKRYRKASNSKPAAQDIVQAIVKEADVAVVALAD